MQISAKIVAQTRLCGHSEVMTAPAASDSREPATGHPAPRVAMAFAILVFVAMGISGAMATTLVPAVRALFGLSLSAAIAVQWIALVVSGIASLPLASVLHRQGAARLTFAGLALVTLGCGAVGLAMLQTGPQPAVRYGMLLGALAVVALGNTALQVAVNLLVVELGTPENAPARLTMAQAFNSLGVLAGVHLGAGFMLGAARPAQIAQGAAHPA